jgi:hypothetical protein
MTQNNNIQNTHGSLFIGELIRRVHKELVDSQMQREAEGLDNLFEVEKLTIEANFVVTQSSEGKGHFDFKVLTFGGVGVDGNNSYKKEQVHKITLVLKTMSSTISESGDVIVIPPTKGLRPSPNED